MSFDWQMLTALGLVLVAAVYLARVAWRAFNSQSGGCGSCSGGGCGSSAHGEKKPLVSIDLPADLSKPRDAADSPE